ncbi:MAG: hypothetical protein P8R54_33250 [Myxococcota bacterium]|nr:hypothetical protein [Myxococcota bacterium]
MRSVVAVDEPTQGAIVDALAGVAALSGEDGSGGPDPGTDDLSSSDAVAQRVDLHRAAAIPPTPQPRAAERLSERVGPIQEVEPE